MSLAWVLWTAVVAAAIVGSGLLGRIEGYTRGHREAILSGLAPQHDSWEVPDPDMCRCTHGRQTHYEGKGSCMVATKPDQKLVCACRRFIVQRHRTQQPAAPRKGELDL